MADEQQEPQTTSLNPEQGAAGTSSGSTEDEDKSQYLTTVSKYWVVFALRGTILIFFGVLVAAFPETSVDAFSNIFGSLMILDGVICLGKVLLVCCCKDKPAQQESDDGPVDPTTKSNPTVGSAGLGCTYFLGSLVNFALGIAAFTYPNETTKVALILISIWFFFIGLLELLLACLFLPAFRSTMACCCSIVGGLLFVSFGITMLALNKDILSFTKVIGVVIVVFGMQVAFVGLMLRKLSKQSELKGGKETTELTPATSDVV